MAQLIYHGGNVIEFVGININMILFVPVLVGGRRKKKEREKREGKMKHLVILLSHEMMCVGVIQ